MNTYKVMGLKTIRLLNDTSMIDIPTDPMNMDFVKFKKEINSDSAKLQDADGIEMTATEAKAFVATLP